MKNLVLLFVALMALSSDAGAYTSQLYTNGIQTNASANTVLATTGAITNGGLLGGNYNVSVILNGSTAMAFKLEVLNAGGSVVTTFYLTSPANQVSVVDPMANFYIPKNYSLRVRNDTTVILGNTHQATIIIRLTDLVDN